MKTCTKCLVEQPVENYWKRSGQPGLEARCKSCKSQYQKNSYKTKDRQWNWHLQKKYGISAVEYAQMILDQDGKCAICGVEVSVERGQRGDPTRACLDHDHATGQNRKILCQTCNTGLGSFKDDIELLQAATTYLQDHAAQVVSTDI